MSENELQCEVSEAHVTEDGCIELTLAVTNTVVRQVSCNIVTGPVEMDIEDQSLSAYTGTASE